MISSRGWCRILKEKGVTKWQNIIIEFNKPYTVNFSAREEWVKSSHKLITAGLVWFTDGSKTEEGVGAGVWGLGGIAEIACSLDTHATAFQAELKAI